MQKVTKTKRNARRTTKQHAQPRKNNSISTLTSLAFHTTQDLLSKLIERDPIKRLGSSASDGHDVMAHPWFAGLDWKKLLRRELPPPFVPVVKSETDVSNFDPYFTKEEAKLTPPSGPEALDVERDESFESFESVAKH